MQLTSMKFVDQRIALAVCLAVCGCNRSPAVPKVQTLPVKGTVTLDGKPLAGAAVRFMLPDPPANFFATTKEDGTYQLQAPEARAALLKGTCQVIVSRMVKPDGSPLAEGELPAMVGAVEQLPPKYSMPNSTILSADVPAEGGTFDFPLESK